MLRWKKISELETNRDIGIDSPQISTDCLVTHSLIDDWTLDYWLGHTNLYTPISEKELRTFRFALLEDMIMKTVDRIKKEFKIANFNCKMTKDIESQEDMLQVNIFIEESDPKKAIEIWKKVSTEIRNEVCKKFGDEFQERIFIRVLPKHV